jgi:hypothetical protein
VLRTAAPPPTVASGRPLSSATPLIHLVPDQDLHAGTALTKRVIGSHDGLNYEDYGFVTFKTREWPRRVPFLRPNRTSLSRQAENSLEP